MPVDDALRVRQLWPKVVSERPHDREAFTQGLVLEGDTLFESVGNYGCSALRVVDASSGTERARVELADEVFAEGVAKVGDVLVQLSWYEETAFLWDAR